MKRSTSCSPMHKHTSENCFTSFMVLLVSGLLCYYRTACAKSPTSFPPPRSS
ncbi:hypothetical protein GBAR_LOCUS12643 [Geodia barretti]|uniref:Uncharacterized protein n=1 Tax=Geodia barretti TaxID=519541 RepID=A0AA35S296_GEOBA|nr:hypothetical protein GBAR_LOCUS12643 [Geodia barretti]